MEYWDLYDTEEKHLNIVHSREDKELPKGAFHIVVETLIRHTDGTYLLMQRDYNKQSNPGLYEASAGGSVLSGETKVAGAIREVREETGIVITSVTPIYYFIEESAIKQGYLAHYSGDKQNIVYQQGETINHKWLTLNEFKKFVETKQYNPSHRERIRSYLITIKE